MRDEDNGYCKQVNKEWGLRYSQVPAIFEKNKSIEKIKYKLDDLNINIENNEDSVSVSEENSQSASSSSPTNYKLITEVNYPLLEYNGNKAEIPKNNQLKK